VAMTEGQIIGAEMERIVPKFATLFDRDSTFYSQVEKRPVEVVSGRDMRIPLEISPGGKFRYVDINGGDFGRGDGPTFDKAVIGTVEPLRAVEWTTKTQWASDDPRKAVVNAFRHLLAVNMAEWRRNIDSQAMGGGDAVLGTISTVADDTPAGFDTYTLDSDGFGAHLVRKGNDISVYSADLLTKRVGGEVEIVFVDIPNKQIRIPAATIVGHIATDKIVAAGLTATPPVGLKGVLYHHNGQSTGNWLGFDRATVPEIRSNRVNAATASLSLELPRLAINRIGDRIGMEYRGKKCQAWMHPAQQSAYESLGFNLIQITKQSKEEALDLYFNDNMRMAGAPVKTSYSWNRKRIDFVDLDQWGRAEMKKPGFYEVDGRKIWELRGATGGIAAAMIFYMIASFNLFVKNPAATAYIDNLAVPSGY